MKVTDEKVYAHHQEFLNKIGNLTLIRGDWNRSMSNRLFEKKKIDFEKSEFPITKKLCTLDKWSFDEIANRSEKCARLALDIWKWSF